MKIQYMSDLHLEFGDYFIPKVVGDVLVLAGDIHVGEDKTFLYLTECAKVFPHVVYVHGNHELYKHDIWDFKKNIKDYIEPFDNIHILDDSKVEIGGISFIGGTMWSSVSDRTFSRMNDSRIIMDSSLSEPLSTSTVNSMFKNTMKYLLDEVPKFDASKTIIVTHHAPSFRSINTSRYGVDSMNDGYATEILKYFPDKLTWIHGHTHHCVDYVYKGIRVLSNQRGYVNYEEVAQFDPEKIIEINNNKEEDVTDELPDVHTPEPLRKME